MILNEQESPVEGEIVDVSITLPVNPEAYLTAIFALPADPASTVTLAGLAVRVNAEPTVYVTDTECESPLPAPVTVTVNVPDETVSVQVSVESL